MTNDRGRVYYSGPEPGMVPSSLADFECDHGIIGDCQICDPPTGKASFCTLCGEPAPKGSPFCSAHSWADE